MELEELDEILDEGNQPRLSEGDEDEDEDVVFAQAERKEEREEDGGTVKMPLYSQVGKYIVEQAQRPTVVVGAVAGVSLVGFTWRARLTRLKPTDTEYALSVCLGVTRQASVGAVIAGPLGAAAGK